MICCDQGVGEETQEEEWDQGESELKEVFQQIFHENLGMQSVQETDFENLEASSGVEEHDQGAASWENVLSEPASDYCFVVVGRLWAAVHAVAEVKLLVINQRSLSRNNHQTWTCCIRLQADVSCCLQTEQVRMVGSELLVFVSASSLSWSLITSSSSTSIWPDPDTLGDPTLLCNIVYH